MEEVEEEEEEEEEEETLKLAHHYHFAQDIILVTPHQCDHPLNPNSSQTHDGLVLYDGFVLFIRLSHERR